MEHIHSRVFIAGKIYGFPIADLPTICLQYFTRDKGFLSVVVCIKSFRLTVEITTEEL